MGNQTGQKTETWQTVLQNFLHNERRAQR